MAHSRLVKYPFKVKNKSALIVHVAPDEYRAYYKSTFEALRRVFPNKPIYVWDMVNQKWIRTEFV